MPDPNSHNNVAASIIEAMEKYHDIKPVQLDSGQALALAVPKGMQLVSIKNLVDEYLVRPDRMRGVAKITSIDSLIAHVNRFKTKHTAAFLCSRSDDDDPLIVAVYDYHEGNTQDAEGNLDLGDPDWCQHRALYTFPLSDEWKAWNAATEQMSQTAFAAFIEDRIADVQDPVIATQSVKDHAEQLGITLASPSQLMSISRNLSIRVEAKATQAVNLTSGETQIVYEEEHKDSNYGPIKVPGAFAIAIPVFKNGALYSIAVRLRYRMTDRKIYWWVSLHNTDRILAHAVDEACAKFTSETAVPLFHGAPEAG